MAGTYGDSLGSWSTDGTLSSATLTAGSAATLGDARSNDTQVGTEVSISATYGGTITGGGVVVYVLKEYDTGSYQATADNPFSFIMSVTASTTIRAVVSIPATVGKFKIALANPTGNSSVTATVKYRPHTGAYT